MLVCLPCVFLLNPTRVRQHDLRKILGPRRTEDSPSITLRNEARQVPDVVEVSVCQNDGVEALGRDRKLIPVSEAQILEPLKQTTVEEDLLTAVLEKVFGPCDGACSTQKCEFRHVMNDDIRLLGLGPSGVLLCPTWERELSLRPSL